MDDSSRRQSWADWFGKVAMVVTCMYATIGMLLQSIKILQTNQTPSMGMIALGALTFLTWSIYASLRQPRETNILVPNVLGFVFSLLTIGLILDTWRVHDRDEASPGTDKVRAQATSDGSASEPVSHERPRHSS